MKITSLKCPNCSNPLRIDGGQKSVICEYCKQQIFVEYEGNDINLSLEQLKENLEDGMEIVNDVIKPHGIKRIAMSIIPIIFFILVACIIGFLAIKSKNEFDKTNFNSDYEFYSGEKSGFFVKKLLDNAITNNKKNKNNIITLKYNDIKTKDTSEITKVKQNLNEYKDYEVSFDYNDEGYIYIINISDIN